MRKISILEEQLLDEYLRCERNLDAQLSELGNLPKGYISKKHIGSKDYYYLQRREGGKIVSKYIPHDELEKMQADISERKRWQESVRNLQRSKKQLERALGKELINEYKHEIRAGI